MIFFNQRIKTLYSLIIVYKSLSQYIICILKIISTNYSSNRIKIKIKSIIRLKKLKLNSVNR